MTSIFHHVLLQRLALKIFRIQKRLQHCALNSQGVCVGNLNLELVGLDMLLYYMTKLETFEKFILPELEIRISTFDKVNDPFELLGAIQGGKVGHRDFAWLKNHWTETVGFVSFSDNWKSPLMWAHYASNHTGVCLGIDVKPNKILKMEYQPRRVALEFDLKKFETAADGELMERLTAIKFQDWAYEHEWRVLLPLQYPSKHPRPEYFYEPFTPDFVLREVILGASCKRSLKEIAEQIFGVTAPVQVKRARPAFGDFSMVQQKLQPPITVRPYTNFTKKELRLLAADRQARARQVDRERKGKSG